MKRLALVALSATTLVAAGCGDDSQPKRDAGGAGGMGGAGGGVVIPDGGVDAAPDTGIPDTAMLPEAGPKLDAGGDAGLGPCPVSAFIRPLDMAMFTARDDSNNNNCSDGFNYDVIVSTNAAVGSAVTLLAGTQQIGQSTVQGSNAMFPGVNIGSQGTVKLTARFANRAECDISLNVTIDCQVPTCQITKPVISPTHPKLNNVPVAQGGDRVSSPGSDYQAAFEVMTNVEDGQSVKLEVANAASPGAITTVTGMAMGGKAVFNGVTLRPDGDYQVTAVCTNKANVVARSATSMFGVDTAGPDLTNVTPADGKFFSPTELAANGGKLRVCGQTPSADAAGLPATLGNMGKNFAAAIGTASGVSAAVSAVNTDACVDLDCPGGAPFDINVTLTDAAGNPTLKKISGVSCASSLPTVAIVAPQGDVAPFSDVSKHILAATAPMGIKDANPSMAGAQGTVVACTDVEGGKARLFGGIAGATLNPIGTEITVSPAVPADNCGNLGFVARWTSVTIPESSQTGAGALIAPTQLRVDVTAPSTAMGTSPLIDLWVDTVTPAVSEFMPNPLCGLLLQSATTAMSNVSLTSTSGSITLSVAGGTGTQQFPVVTYQIPIANFGSVTFEQGDNTVTAVATDPAGNVGALKSPCVVRVGQSPVVSWEAPGQGQNLCASGNTATTCLADGSGDAGWQGTLRVKVLIGGVPATTGNVTFRAGTTDLGTAAIDGNGIAQLANVSIADAASVTLEATTDNFASTGTGTASRTVLVDTSAPAAPANLAASVKLRRQTTFLFEWDAPTDGGGTLAGYSVRVSRTPIDSNNFGAAESVQFTGVPTLGGRDKIDVADRLIERDYYFAVAGVDSVGNVGPIASFGPSKASFNTTILSPTAGGPANERFGYSVEGSTDWNGDGLTDIVVGGFTSQRVFIFPGKQDFTTPSTPIVLNGPAGRFGRSVAEIGDIDGDGRVDLAIGAPQASQVFIIKGRANWASSINVPSGDVPATDYTIDLGAPYVGSNFGDSLAKLGDFNGDGVDDFAVGAPFFNGGRGRVVVVLGSATFDPTMPNVITIDGDPAFTLSGLGIRLAGLGRFYTGGGHTLVAGATAINSNAGRAYAVRGPGPSMAFDITSANHLVDGPAGSFYGTNVGFLGSLGGTVGVVIATPTATGGIGNGFVDIYLGSAAAGPFGGTRVRVTNSAASQGADGFGQIAFGSGFNGTGSSTNIIGDGSSDVVLGSVRENGTTPRVYLFDGSKVASLGANADAPNAADVILTLPSGWIRVPAQAMGVLRDINGDGYGDVAIGENENNQVGRLAVFW